MARWTLLVAAAYLVIYGTVEPIPVMHQLAALVALLCSLLAGTLTLSRPTSRALRVVAPVADIAAVSVAIAVVGGSIDEFLLFFFIVVMLAGISQRLWLATLGTALVCGVYGGLLYAQGGPEFWHDTHTMIRIPFLFAVGMFFGAVTDISRNETDRIVELSDATRKMVHRYHQVASERDRTQALLDIGQMALSAVDPDDVLDKITRKVRQTVRVARCSMILFNNGERHAYLAACSDQKDTDVVLLLSLNHYPELEQTLASGEITELYPNKPTDLWQKVEGHLPSGQFNSRMVIPILEGNTVAGAFFLRDSRENFAFHDDEKVFCRAAALMTATYLQGRHLVEEMRRRTRLDGLTGLLNYQSFREELEAELDERRRGDNSKPLSLVMVDVDNLKVINDRYGHNVGNKVIVEVGKRLKRAVPMASSLCRYGGDEFFAVVPRDKVETIVRMERMPIELEHLTEADVPCKVQVSIGVAGWPEDGDQPDTLSDAADRAMYMAKSEGGNCAHPAGALGEDEGKIFEAVIAVNARRLIPGETKAFRQVLNELLRMEEQQLDSENVQQSLEALMEAVESKDRYTNTHSHEVSDLTREVATAMGMSDRELLAVEMAGLVHDIGKIGIPDEVLQKPGALDTRERMLIEQHPEIGAQILKPLPALKDVVPLVLHHHERWDGGGYPHGLKGDEIPLGAQIVALCDVYHALTSDRSYRPAFSEEKSRAIIRDGIGSEWNPELIETFFAVIDRLQASSPGAAARAQPAQPLARTA